MSRMTLYRAPSLTPAPAPATVVAMLAFTKVADVDVSTVVFEEK